MSDFELIIDYEKCTGCRLCETVCAMSHGPGPNPQLSRIQVIKIEKGPTVTPIPARCMQCQEPPCQAVCPTEAISTDSKTGSRVINEKRCIGCSSCVYACPFGAAALDRSIGKSIICDLCEGDPWCARFCPFEALQYVRCDQTAIRSKRSKVGRIVEALKLFSASSE